MAKYLFIESQDPFVTRQALEGFELVASLAQQGHEVALFLVQNAVLVLRQGVQVPAFLELMNKKQIAVYADDYALAERGIEGDEIADRVQPAAMDRMVALMMEEGRIPIWH